VNAYRVIFSDLLFINISLLFTGESKSSADNAPENKAAESVSVSGVNRRTMILFSKKAKQRRLSAIQLMAAKDFEKKEPVKIDTSRTDVSELSRRSTANGFTVKLPLEAETSAVGNATMPAARRPPTKRPHTSVSGHTESVVCNGTVTAGNRVLTGVTSHSKPGTSDDARRKNNQHKIRVVDMSAMLNGVSDSDLSDIGSSRYPIRGGLLPDYFHCYIIQLVVLLHKADVFQRLVTIEALQLLAIAHCT